VIIDGSDSENNCVIKPNKLFSKFVIFDAKAKERNIIEKIDKDTTPYPQIEALAGPLVPSGVILLWKNNLIIIPTMAKAMKLFTRYSLVVDGICL
jgi:hypothetical protein